MYNISKSDSIRNWRKERRKSAPNQFNDDVVSLFMLNSSPSPLLLLFRFSYFLFRVKVNRARKNWFEILIETKSFHSKMSICLNLHLFSFFISFYRCRHFTFNSMCIQKVALHINKRPKHREYRARTNNIAHTHSQPAWTRIYRQVEIGVWLFNTYNTNGERIQC